MLTNATSRNSVKTSVRVLMHGSEFLPRQYAMSRRLSSKFLICHTFQSASMSLKTGKYVVRVSTTLYLDETLSYLAPIRIKLFADSALVGFGWLKVKEPNN